MNILSQYKYITKNALYRSFWRVFVLCCFLNVSNDFFRARVNSTTPPPTCLLFLCSRTAEIARENVREHQLENLVGVRRLQPRDLGHPLPGGLRSIPAVDAAEQAEVQANPQTACEAGESVAQQWERSRFFFANNPTYKHR